MHIEDAHAVDARLELMRELRGLSSAEREQKTEESSSHLNPTGKNMSK